MVIVVLKEVVSSTMQQEPVTDDVRLQAAAIPCEPYIRSRNVSVVQHPPVHRHPGRPKP